MALLLDGNDIGAMQNTSPTQSSIRDVCRRSLLGAVGWLLLLAIDVCADLQIAPLFSDHMVLQRDRPIPVWGTSEKHSIVHVRLHDHSVTASADAGGAWRVSIPPLHAGGPYRLSVLSVSDSLHVDDILIGDVWLAAGQSNMSWPLAHSTDGASEIAAANWPEIRLLTVPNVVSNRPVTEFKADWVVCRPDAAADFSAVAYFFGRRLHEEVGVPIGLIEAAWPATPIEAWIDPVSLRRLSGIEPKLSAQMEQVTSIFADHTRSTERWEAALLDEAMATAMTGADVDLRDWTPHRIPGQWAFHGMVWFRKGVEIPDTWSGRRLLVDPGPLSAQDVVYYDSHPLVADADGVWQVPADRVKPGPVRIAVRAIDSSYRGGIFGGDSRHVPRLILAGDVDEPPVSLSGTWRQMAGERLPTPMHAPHTLPTTIYQAMIYPLQSTGIRGVIWYQGEANVSDPAYYTDKMRGLIGGWRTHFSQDALPFYFVQLPPFRYNARDGLPLIQEAQTLIAQNTNAAAMIVISDVGDSSDLHPPNKRPVGERLAGLALSQSYEQQNLRVHGPTYDGMRVEGARVFIDFVHAEGGLNTRDGEPVSHVEIAGADGVFLPAHAQIEGESLVVHQPGISAPSAVRFAWHETAMPNLVNQAGLPAGPFRTP